MQTVFNSMIKELEAHKRNREDLLKIYITERLSKSLKTYYDELSSSINYLRYKDDLKVMKNINKESIK